MNAGYLYVKGACWMQSEGRPRPLTELNHASLRLQARSFAWGWLLLMAWASAIRNNQQNEALEFLRYAKTAAAAIGNESIRYRHYWTTLGLATVAMKEVEHETVLSGDWRNALTLAKAVPGTSNTRSDVRQRHELGLAKAHAGLTEYSAAVSILAALQTRTTMAAPSTSGQGSDPEDTFRTESRPVSGHAHPCRFL